MCDTCKKKFYITTPIYYPSAKLHIGHTYCTVATDAMARYKRLQGCDVMFLTGTDEHGQKIEEKAKAAGVTPQQFVDNIVTGPKGVLDLWKLMNISNDRFIRTTDDYHVAAIQRIFHKMYENGDIYKGSYKGKYCTPCESFWTESQLVDGKCPDCGTCTSPHYVRVDFLEEVVLGEIRRLTKFASLYEDEFVKAVIGHSQQAEQTDRKLKEKELKTLLARDEELDGLFERIYEDNVSGKLSDDRFAKMSRRYEEEQKELAEKIKKIRSEIEKQSSRSMTTDMFIGLVRKYTRARKLTPRMLNELVEKIEVFNAEKIDGVWEQRLRIHYNCVGTIEIPTVLPLPIPEVSVNTRKGVVVNYAPCELAV